MIKNVVLITVDCLRADHLSCYGYERKTTPNLDELAKKGILFTHAFANGPWTPASFPSILTSTYPLQYPHFDYHLSPERVMLSEILKGKGYSTGAFHSNPYLSSFYGYNRGFDIFSDFLFTKERIEVGRANPFLRKAQTVMKSLFGDQGSFYRFSVNIRKKIIKESKRNRMKKAKKLLEIDQKIEDAEVTNAKAISWLKNTKMPFFLWIHYMDVRVGYTPPEKCLEFFTYFASSLRDKTKIRKLSEKKYRWKEGVENFSDHELRLMKDLYDAEIRYTDGHIKFLLDEISDLELLRDTLVIVSADHGEELLEHGGIGHGAKLYDELLHVPLILNAPELGKSRVLDDLVSLIDLAPTVVDILNIRKPEKWLGKSLLPLIKGEEKRIDNGVISEVSSGDERKTAYRTKKWKLILDEEKNAYELYDLENDREEKNNVAKKNPDIVNYFSFKINKHISMENKRSREVEERKRTEKNIKKLKAGGKI